jgi:uncharacterized phage-associated protein
MPQSIDVAEYVLKRFGAISAMKLQKLVYYCQAWSLVWDGRPLFDDEIEAWANGPVAPVLYRAHRGESLVHLVGGNAEEIAADAVAQETIASVLEFYGDKSSQWLSDLTHAERPWKDARGDLPPGAPGTRAINRDAMAAYYSQL